MARRDTAADGQSNLGDAFPDIISSMGQMGPLLASMGIGTIFLNKERSVALVNDAARDILGIESTALGKPLWESVSEKCIVDLYANLPTSDTPSSIESTILRDGGIRSIKLHAAMLCEGLARPSGWIVTVNDVTKEKDADRIKSEFVSTTSHELRTPLASIKEAVMLVLDGMSGTLTPEQDRFLSIARRNIDRLSDVIDDLLDISRLEDGKFRLKTTPCDLKELVGQAIESIKVLARGRQIGLIQRIPDDLPHIRCDPERITQVMMNLIGNAIKFTPAGGSVTVDVQSIFCNEFSDGDERTVEVSGAAGLSGEPLSANGVEIKIIDTGIGIEEKDMDRLFTRFGQLEPSLTRKHGGTGLGLAISKEIVEMHGGKIAIESKAGSGTVVQLTLPA